MKRLHADECGAPICGDWTDGGDTTLNVTAVDCARCLDAMHMHVCGISDPYEWCDGCRVMAGDAGGSL